MIETGEGIESDTPDLPVYVDGEVSDNGMILEGERNGMESPGLQE